LDTEDEILMDGEDVEGDAEKAMESGTSLVPPSKMAPQRKRYGF